MPVPLPSLRNLLLAALTGVLYVCAFVHVGVWPLAFVCFVPLLFALRRAAAWREALALSWLAGLVANLGGYFWVVHLLRAFAGAPAAIAVPGYVLLCVYQGASLGVAGLGTWWLSRRGPLAPGLALPIALAASELAFPLVFPSYLASSLAWVTPAIQVVDLGGPILLSAVVALANGAVFELGASLADRRPLPWRTAAASALVLAGTLVYGVARVEQIERRDAAAPALKVAIVQANVGEAFKHDHAQEGIARYRRMTAEAMRIPGVDLVVWPETALNRDVDAATRNLASDVSEGPPGAPMIVGAVRVEVAEDGKRAWNSAFALDARGDVTGRYDKIERVILGEYVPGDTIFPWVYELLRYSGYFQPGRSLEPLRIGDHRLSANICYEDILPGLVRRLMRSADGGGARPEAIVNLTNDSWYGRVEPPIHLALSVFRAVEHRRWMVRATATGVSAFIDASGRAVKRSGLGTAELLAQDVPMIRGGPTAYGVLGDWPGYLAVGYLALVLVLRRR